MNTVPTVSSSPPRAPPIKYSAPLGTRWAKETAAAGGVAAFDLPTDPKNIGPWILGECVGKGASGRVKIAKHRITGQLAAVKILPIAPVISSRTSLATQQAKYDKQRLGIDREIAMMKLMNHPNIIRIYDVFEGNKELFLVLEYVEGGELFDFLVNRGRLPSDEALAYFKQIVYGLSYAHRFSIIHRDLKPENILIATMTPPVIKIADWGMAAFAPPTLQLETSCGSPHYASPEIVNGQKYQGNATDIWSCGVILYALLTGRLPFDDKNVKTLLGKVKSGKYEMPNWIDPLAQDLLSRMLVVDVNKRITIEDIQKHPWFLSSSSTPEEQAIEVSLAGLAPSPSTLARPIPSPSRIDHELFSSLRIIWGRHTDPEGETIKSDLCSPAGEGVHAKAFYYLLGKHREETRSKDGYEYDLADEGRRMLLTVTVPDFLAVTPVERSRYREISTTSGGHVENMIAPSRLACPLMRRSTIFDNPSSFSPRDRPSSPAGPRAPPSGRRGLDHWRARPSIVDEQAYRHPKGTSSETSACNGPQPGPRRGNTYTYSPGDGVSTIAFPSVSPEHLTAEQRPQSTIGLPVAKNHARSILARYSVDGRPSQAASQTPQPLTRRHSVRANVVLGGHNHGSSSRGATDSTEPQKATSSSPFIFVDAPKSLSPVKSTERQVKRSSRGDKENNDGNGTRPPEEHGSRGLGLGVSREIGRNLGNVISSVENGVGFKGKKERKNRPPTLELRNLGQTRRTVLGSPIQLSSPVNISSASSRMATSPMVGEVRGWFQNLFSWKNPTTQGGGLYSSAGISQTRTDTLKLLQDSGVVVENDPPTYAGDVDISAFRCRIDGPVGGSWSGASQLKPSRFRVEFVLPPKNTSTDVDGRTQTHYFLNTPSPNVPTTPALSAPPSRSRHSILMSRKSLTAQVNSPLPSDQIEFPLGAECAIVMVFEKGSMSAFKTVWRKLKDAYGSGIGSADTYSPFMNTPISEYPERILT